MYENIITTKDKPAIINKEKRVTMRKIGKCTFLVSSSFKDGKERDVVATIARLVQNDTAPKPGA